MDQSLWRRFTFLGIFAATSLSPVSGQASSQLAVEKGCYACHGAYPRGDAPPFDKLSRRRASAAHWN